MRRILLLVPFALGLILAGCSTETPTGLDPGKSTIDGVQPVSQLTADPNRFDVDRTFATDNDPPPPPTLLAAPKKEAARPSQEHRADLLGCGEGEIPGALAGGRSSKGGTQTRSRPSFR